MKKYMSNNQGYTLLTIMLIFTILSVAGLSLLSMVVNSQRFVSVSENEIKDVANAEMIMEEFIARFQHEVETEKRLHNVLLGTTLESRITEVLEDVIMNISQPEIVRYEVEEIMKPNSDSSIFAIDLYVKVNDTKQLEKTLSISFVPDALNYTVGVKDTLQLNGPAYLEGNIIAANSLITSNTTAFELNSLNFCFDYQKAGSSNNGNSLGSIKNNTPEQCGSQNTSPTIPTKLAYIKGNISANTVGQIAGTDYTENKNNEVPITINVEEIIKQADLTNIEPITKVNDLASINKNTFFKSNSNKVNLSGSINFTGLNEFLFIESEEVTFTDLNIGGNGKILIKGQLNINGSIKSEVPIFVYNEQNLNTKINLLPSAQNKIHLYSQNSITLSHGEATPRNLKDEDYYNTPIEVNGFLYTNQNLKINAIVYKYHFNGALSAQTASFNTIFGNTIYYSNPSEKLLYIEEQCDGIDTCENHFSPEDSRLKIKYDPNVLTNLPIQTRENVITLTEIDQRISNKN